jgi:hypothetical protein
MSSDGNLNDDETKAALARAFDGAWERFIQLEGAEGATEDNCKRLATQIVASAKAGELDEEHLAEAGLIYLRVLAEADRIAARQRANIGVLAFPSRDGRSANAYTPETVDAMSTALQLCLDELPLRLPSDTVASLSSSILDDASRGERDPDRLRDHALARLKTHR